jgi:hypothetical protein
MGLYWAEEVARPTMTARVDELASRCFLDRVEFVVKLSGVIWQEGVIAGIICRTTGRKEDRYGGLSFSERDAQPGHNEAPVNLGRGYVECDIMLSVCKHLL